MEPLNESRVLAGRRGAGRCLPSTVVSEAPRAALGCNGLLVGGTSGPAGVRADGFRIVEPHRRDRVDGFDIDRGSAIDQASRRVNRS
jgi:hypothetical protein